MEKLQVTRLWKLAEEYVTKKCGARGGAGAALEERFELAPAAGFTTKVDGFEGYEEAT